MGGTLGVSTGRTDGGTMGQIVGEHIGRRSMALEQTASGRPFTQVHVQAAKASDDWRPKTASAATVDSMRMAASPLKMKDQSVSGLSASQPHYRGAQGRKSIEIRPQFCYNTEEI
jgi:hypothetical protein